MAIEAGRIGCILLAAGRSVRFGENDKMAAALGGKPLLHHALAVLDEFPFGRKIVVVRPDSRSIGSFGFTRREIDSPDALQSDSLKCGVEALLDNDLAGILVALGDMPSISVDHVARLLERFDPADPKCVVASTNGVERMPPALFAIGFRDALRAADNDRGARGLLAQAALVQASDGVLADIDTPDDLRHAENAAERRRGER